MEFLELLQEVQQFIPSQYAGVSQAIDTFYPYIFSGICDNLLFWLKNTLYLA